MSKIVILTHHIYMTYLSLPFSHRKVQVLDVAEIAVHYINTFSRNLRRIWIVVEIFSLRTLENLYFWTIHAPN